jgi:hypothetical protein
MRIAALLRRLPELVDRGQRLPQALDAVGFQHRYHVRRRGDRRQAATVGFAGSSTFRVDGSDLFDQDAGGGALTCRVYATPGGLVGVPTDEDLVMALGRRLTNDTVRRNFRPV